MKIVAKRIASFDVMHDVIVKMGIELVWSEPATNREEIARRQNIEAELQRKIFKFRQKIRAELLDIVSN